jgi:Protein of unknown function (DUF4231)
MAKSEQTASAISSSGDLPIPSAVANRPDNTLRHSGNDVSPEKKLEEAWRHREAKIVDAINTVADENYRVSTVYKRWHLSCSVIVMVCAVLAPLFIASSRTTNFTIQSDSLNIISLSLTVILGITEGLRRIFRFEQRWYAYYSASNALVQTRERYLDNTVEHVPGSEKWKEEFFSLHKEVQVIFNEQNKLFFQGVLEHSELSGPNSKRRTKLR